MVRLPAERALNGDQAMQGTSIRQLGLAKNSWMAARQRPAAAPSQYLGTRPVLGFAFICSQAWRMLSGVVPARMLVPSSTVTGRSVLLRRVRQGIPRAVVSS